MANMFYMLYIQKSYSQKAKIIQTKGKNHNSNSDGSTSGERYCCAWYTLHGSRSGAGPRYSHPITTRVTITPHSSNSWLRDPSPHPASLYTITTLQHRLLYHNYLHCTAFHTSIQPLPVYFSSLRSSIPHPHPSIPPPPIYHSYIITHIHKYTPMYA